MDFFHAAYRGRPPWDIGRAQKEFVALEESGEIVGSVLDIGCGTGDNALFYAAEGHEVWGIDATELAIRKAREKASARGLCVNFLVMDARDLLTLKRTFDTVTDSGFFHTLSDEGRQAYIANLAAVLPPGGRYFMLCFSDREPQGYGPRRITQEEIRNSFSGEWVIRYIRPAVFESHTRAEGSKAYLASVVKKMPGSHDE